MKRANKRLLGYFAGILHVFAKKTNMAAMSVSAVQVALLFVVGAGGGGGSGCGGVGEGSVEVTMMEVVY